MLGLPTWALLLFVVGLSAIILGHAAFMKEGFAAGEPGIRCGVDMPNCIPGKICMNGFCQRPAKPSLPDNELPIFPKGLLNSLTL